MKRAGVKIEAEKEIVSNHSYKHSMEPIKKTISLQANARQAFKVFVEQINNWWPKIYTWSGEVLQHLMINPVQHGLITEEGPNGFRCDWGTVTQINETTIVFLWQIGPHREPVPDPAKASEVSVSFSDESPSSCELELVHRNFEKHGKGSDQYREAMDSEQGWDVILDALKNFIDQQKQD